MENHNNQPPQPPALRPSSAASLTAQLFGYNDSQYSSSGILSSIFPPPSLVAGHASFLRCSQPIQYEAFDSQVWSTLHGTSAENVAKNTAIANSGVINTERRSIFQERIEPCPLSSSIYYGGQEDIYIRSSSDLTSKLYTKFSVKEDSKEGDDPNHLQGATRGNWWQGSLYY